MPVEDIKIAESFRRSAIRAVGGIVFFIFVYILLIILALAFLVACMYGGISVIALRPSFITLMIGLGLVAMGVLVVIFLFKFMFQRHKSDLSHLTEVTREQEPALFSLIDDLTTKVGTSKPRKVYLSSGVNASVFYDSSFWSMFLPVKKNLEVGMGLVNSVTVNELRAVLAHEFGHFSQRSMKVGSYVYFVNRVIFNMLFDNEGYAGVANSVARVNSYLNFFTGIAIRIVHGIQWVLRKVYGVVNLSYLKLSREMEFHADEVAARTTGSLPLVESLQRLDLANRAYETVTEFYQQKAGDAIRAANLFRQQSLVMRKLAEHGKFQERDGLPIVSSGQAARFQRSRLVFSNQWASHPSTEDRVARLNALAIPEAYADHGLARTVFSNPDATERMLTDKLFAAVTYEKEVTEWDEAQFLVAYEQGQDRLDMPEVFNGYYEAHNPTPFDLGNVVRDGVIWRGPAGELFGDKAVERIYDRIGMESDLQVVEQIGKGDTGVKRFEYDGEKCQDSDCAALAERIGRDLAAVKAEIVAHDQAIYGYVHALAEKAGMKSALEQVYADYFRTDKLVDEMSAACDAFVGAMAFTNQTTGYDVIETNLEAAKPLERAFKERLSGVIAQDEFQKHIDPEMRDQFQRYLDNNAVYFIRPDYQDHVFTLFYGAVKQFRRLMWLLYRERKSAMLGLQAELLATG